MIDKRVIRSKLIEIARLGEVRTYKELNDELHLFDSIENQHNGTALGKILSIISMNELQNGRPPLGSLIIKSSTKKPGDGFYTLLGKVFFTDADKLQKNKAFNKENLDKCFEYWKNEANYKKYKDVNY